MKILITGGAGFIGSHLCNYLIKQNHKVVCLDNFFTGEMKNISHLIGNSNFELINHDIIEPIDLDIDQIYNLACPASPIHYQFDPVTTIKTSVIGAINMLDLAKKCNARILQASTSEVYGDPKIHPQKESYWGNVNPIGPRSCYDEGKRAAETLFSDYNKQYSLDIRIVRIFNTFGTNMTPNDGRVVSNFIIQALQGDPITIYGDGNQTRSFCYISDLVKGLYLMMNQENTIGPINLGNPTELKINDLALKIISLAKSKSIITQKNLPQDDPIKRKPDITLAKQILKWKPEVSIDKGLTKTINYFKRIIKS